MTDLSSCERGSYIRTVIGRVQLENKITGRESQGTSRQKDLIDSKPPVAK
jgi:hypothetical protein